MNERKISESGIQEVVRTIHYPQWEPRLVQMTEKWNSGDFEYAIDRLGTDQPADRREALRAIYMRLWEKRRAEETQAVVDAIEAQRHEDISRKLEELKKPHWSTVPNFWMTFAILVLTLIMTILAFRH